MAESHCNESVDCVVESMQLQTQVPKRLSMSQIPLGKACIICSETSPVALAMRGIPPAILYLSDRAKASAYQARNMIQNTVLDMEPASASTPPVAQRKLCSCISTKSARGPYCMAGDEAGETMGGAVKEMLTSTRPSSKKLPSSNSQSSATKESTK
mmetsp:Transcript_7501/g.11947  ORF Transcript_7501/g.11947 Transcript_7501/m.11947 type:complete len:156 (-) Transcript_7501:88-555(-)